MTERLAKKVLLVGWDAADWNLINPLLDAGEMPVLAKFVGEGVMGNLATVEPSLSPILWTTIATGKLGDKHGILCHGEADADGTGVRPVTSTSRKCKAIWNILTQSGLRSNVVDWYASHPAEPINGVIVSNLYSQVAAPPDQPWPVQPGTVHPARLADALAELRVHPGTLSGRHLLPFVPNGAKIDQQQDHRLSVLGQTLAQCASVHNAATWLMENEPWDFMGIYYAAIDTLGHHFMRYHPPRMEDVSEEDFENYKEVVLQTYRYHDMMLGRLLELAGDDTTVILCSDHGFRSGDDRPREPERKGVTTIPHRKFGIVCMKGPHIKRDERVYGGIVYDITPTVLALFGLPVAADMDGRPMLQAFEGPVKLEAIPSWDDVPGEAGLHPADLQVAPLDAQEAIRQLVELGYIEQPDKDGEETATKVAQAAKFSLAHILAGRGRPEEAVPLLEELVREGCPRLAHAYTLLAQCHYSLKQLDRCREAAECALKLEEDNGKALLLMGLVHLTEGNEGEALACFQRVEEAKPNNPTVHCSIGSVHLQMKRWEDAERSYRKAIRAKSDSVIAHDGLAAALLQQERWQEAAEESLAAVGILHHAPKAHYHLGLALARMGMAERAIQAFETCLVVGAPPEVAVEAHRWLAMIYEEAMENPERAAEHRRKVQELTVALETPGPAAGDLTSDM